MLVPVARAILVVFLPPSLHQRFVAFHAKYSLRRPCILEILNLLFAIPAFEACCAESLVTRKDGQIFDLVRAHATTVGAIVAYERSIAQKEEVRVRVEYCTAGIASKAVYVPSISR